MTDDGGDLTAYFMQRGELRVAKKNGDPEARAALEAKLAALEVDQVQRAKRTLEGHQQRKASERELWRKRSLARRDADRRSNLHQGLIEITPDAGPVPTLQWWQTNMAHRLPTVHFADIRIVGVNLLLSACSKMHANHPNPTAYILRYYKRVKNGEVADWVDPKDIVGREHLILANVQKVRFSNADSQVGELPPGLADTMDPIAQDNMHEYREAVRQGRPGPLLPIGRHCPPAHRQPGED